MAKRTTTLPPAPELDEVNEMLLELAEMLLSDFFFDPENEQRYKQRLLKNRPAGSAGLVLDEDSIELSDGDCNVRIEALRALSQFRVVLTHPAFSASAEGTWSFENEDLGQAKFTRTGDPHDIQDAVEAMILAVDGGDLGDEEFADFMEGVEDGDDEVPLIGDDPAEPPAATARDRDRLKAVAKRLAQKPDAGISLEDGSWLEQMPQTLPVIAESLITAAGSARRDEKLIAAYQILLAAQLEFVRYRQDRGWGWADNMLTAFQKRLVEVGAMDMVPRDDWFVMCTALTEARVPVSENVQVALADAGFKPDDDTDGPPEEMMRTLRGFMDELARMVSSPFEVVEALKGSGAMLPATLRGFLATELALSPHGVLRDTVPLLLLDDDSMVRTAAARALEQTAHPDTLSPDALRRAIIVRNWIPPKDRPALDIAIRKARRAGVEIGPWPAPTRDLELYASIVDGSGAQSILATTRVAKKGLFGGLLLRHGTGVVDGWADYDLSRAKITKLMREAQMTAPMVKVEKNFIDIMVQHAIGTSVERDAVPPPSLLEIAEVLGGAEWKDRRIDVKAEADRLFDALDEADRTSEGIKAGYARLADWTAQDDVFATWYEDGPQVQKVLAKLPRTDKAGMTALVLTKILPTRRAQWTERFLVLAMWSEAAADAKQRARARDLVQVTHALAGDEKLDAIPAMVAIAAQTVRATLLGAW